MNKPAPKDYALNNGEGTILVSENSPTSDLMDYYTSDFADRYGTAASLEALDGARRIVEEYTERQVLRARHEGFSWEVIGQALDVTRQAAQQRYGATA